MYTWARYGGYEVSSKGDKRFSAFYAIMPDGRSLEMHYQCDVKGYDFGGTNWTLGKGKPPKRKCDLWFEYLNLWRIWVNNRPQRLVVLKEELIKANTNILSDRFANSEVNQARALAFLLNEMER